MRLFLWFILAPLILVGCRSNFIIYNRFSPDALFATHFSTVHGDYTRLLILRHLETSDHWMPILDRLPFHPDSRYAFIVLIPPSMVSDTSLYDALQRILNYAHASQGLNLDTLYFVALEDPDVVLPTLLLYTIPLTPKAG